jgi:hypothetical protein
MPDVLRDAGGDQVDGVSRISLELFGFVPLSQCVWREAPGRYGCCTMPLTRTSRAREVRMHPRGTAFNGLLALVMLIVTGLSVRGQSGTETFSATATVTTAGAATASAPVTIVVDRKMSQGEADSLIAAFKTGGATALRKALVGVTPTGSVRLGGGPPTPTRLTLERPTDKGRLLTIVSDTPILFLGAGVPTAKAREGYDFAIIDIEVDRNGSGSGVLAPAARVTVKQGVFVVEDYASELVRLTAVSKTK